MRALLFWNGLPHINFKQPNVRRLFPYTNHNCKHYTYGIDSNENKQLVSNNAIPQVCHWNMHVRKNELYALCSFVGQSVQHERPCELLYVYVAQIRLNEHLNMYSGTLRLCCDQILNTYIFVMTTYNSCSDSLSRRKFINKKNYPLMFDGVYVRSRKPKFSTCCSVTFFRYCKL